MTLRDGSALLRDLALEQRRVGAHARHGRIPLSDHRARRGETAARIVGEDRDKAQGVVALRHAEHGQQPPPFGAGPHDGLGEILRGHDGHRGHRDRLAIAKVRERVRGHGAPPSVDAASVNIACSGAGM